MTYSTAQSYIYYIKKKSRFLLIVDFISAVAVIMNHSVRYGVFKNV